MAKAAKTRKKVKRDWDDGLSALNRNAAGIDVGNSDHYVAVPKKKLILKGVPCRCFVIRKAILAAAWGSWQQVCRNLLLASCPEGNPQADAYAGFNRLYDTGRIQEAAC